MSRITKTAAIVLILKLAKERAQISFVDIAQAAGFSSSDTTERKTIQRALADLVKSGELVPEGKTRARVYISRGKQALPVVSPTPLIKPATGVFEGVPLSTTALALLQHLEKPTQARTPVSYNQGFLRSYEPNKRTYLSEAQRAELLGIGRSGGTIQPAGTYARDILSRLLIDLSWNSSRLEGNTYSLLDTKNLIELGHVAAGKDATEAQMILNHKQAIEFIVESAAEPEISSFTICSVHALLSENLLSDSSDCGRLRQNLVSIGGSTYLPLENPHAIKEMFEVFIQKLNLIQDPFEQSLFSIVQLSYLQAFADVNKRTARVVANIPMVKHNLKPLSYTDVDKEAYVKSILGVYENNDISLVRDLFIWAYKRSAQRYSAIQQAMGAPNLMKLKHRASIQEIVRTIILEKVNRSQVPSRLKALVSSLGLSESESAEVLQIVEMEIASLHDGNIARFRVRPSEFQAWQSAN